MPYLKTPNGHLFDFELETFHNGEDIVEFVNDIFAGKTFEDKYGNILNLKSREDKKKFASDINGHPSNYNFIVSKMTDKEKKLFDRVLSIYSE